jgi:hypothetical protein
MPETLRRLPAQAIVAALETGKMRSQGSQLSAAQQNVIANYLGTSDNLEVIPPSATCSASPKLANNAKPATKAANGMDGESILATLVFKPRKPLVLLARMFRN